MDFTTEQIARLTTSLRGSIDHRREGLLSLILAEWGRVDLEEHLNLPPPSEVRTEIKQLERLARRAEELARMISTLTPTARFTIAGWQLEAFSPIRPGSEILIIKGEYSDIHDADRRLGEDAARLKEIAVAASKTAAMWQPSPMRHNTVIRYLILQDLAAISEYATREKASRKVHIDPHPDTGLEYGAFWDLANAAWPIIFGSTEGLSYAVQWWAATRIKYGEQSPVIANIALRYPEWGILRR